MKTVKKLFSVFVVFSERDRDRDGNLSIFKYSYSVLSSYPQLIGIHSEVSHQEDTLESGMMGIETPGEDSLHRFQSATS